jgi:catechol 2,3-dioxygenase-like lactoylglutathione lyase family enzyme
LSAGLEGECVEIVGLDHIQLAMPAGCEEAGRQFYVGCLGLREVRKPASLSSRGGCWFVGPGMAIHLGVENDFAPALKAHLAFRVADLEAARKALLAAGAPVVEDTSLEGVRRFYSEDVFGNRLEFTQSGDTAPWAGPRLPSR